MSYEPLDPSAIGSADQLESEIGPVWPFAVAVAFVKSTVPKSDSGSGVQLPEPSHWDGASAIHSALEVSGLGDATVFENDCPVVSSFSENEVLEPLTLTLAVMWSPGWIVRLSWTGAAGTSSYQA